MLTAALVVLVLTGFTPFGVNDLTPERARNRAGVALNVAHQLLLRPDRAGQGQGCGPP